MVGSCTERSAPAWAAPGRTMSERTFRAVVAAVLVGALVLAAIAVFAVLQPPTPVAVPTASPRRTAPPTPVPTPTPTPPIALGTIDVTPVASVARGGASGTTLVLRFVESKIDAIRAASGSFTVTLADSAGAGATITFTGKPTVDAPGWMGATAQLVTGNVLRVSIAMSDRTLLEQFTVTGLGIRATAGAALGPIGATLGDFSGSLAGGVANVVLASPGTVVAGP